jgi:hypothetical protein
LVTAVAVAVTLLMAAPAAAFAAFGAIAVDPFTHHWGKSWGYSTKRGAELRALSECRSGDPGTHCQGVVWYKNECAAVSENSSETKFYFAGGSTKRAAKHHLFRLHPGTRFITAGCATHG